MSSSISTYPHHPISTPISDSEKTTASAPQFDSTALVKKIRFLESVIADLEETIQQLRLRSRTITISQIPCSLFIAVQ